MVQKVQLTVKMWQEGHSKQGIWEGEFLLFHPKVLLLKCTFPISLITLDAFYFSRAGSSFTLIQREKT